MSDDLISRQAAIEALNEYIEEYGEVDENGLHDPKWCAMMEARTVIESLPSAQHNDDAVYEQGRIQGHVEMRTELLMQLKEIVGDEVWKNI